MDSLDKPSIAAILKPMTLRKNVAGAADDYLHFYQNNNNVAAKDESHPGYDRKEQSLELSNHFYDLATDFYEYGWGESFHFATMRRGESREHSFAKHEYRLALKLGLKPEHVALDLGCGIGGPVRHIASFTGAKIIGLNCNDYQLQRACILTKKVGLDRLCTFLKGDFCDAPLESGSVDRVFAIEATCHASDLTAVYGEAYRLLKPGGLFACYEWALTDKYDANNPTHQQIKEDLLEGNGVPDLVSTSQVVASLKKVGFDVLEKDDVATGSELPWYSVLQPQWTLSDIKLTPFGRFMTHTLLTVMEIVGLVPKGAVKVHATLQKAARGLINGGQEGVFTPMFYFLVRKPETGSVSGNSTTQKEE